MDTEREAGVIREMEGRRKYGVREGGGKSALVMQRYRVVIYVTDFKQTMLGFFFTCVRQITVEKKKDTCVHVLEETPTLGKKPRSFEACSLSILCLSCSIICLLYSSILSCSRRASSSASCKQKKQNIQRRKRTVQQLPQYQSVGTKTVF